VLALACWILWATRSLSVLPHGFAAASRERWLVLIALLLPVAAIVPGAVETRFFLPLHLLAYGVIAFRFDPLVQQESIRRHGLTQVATIVAAAAVFFAVSLETMANVKYHWPDQYKHGLAR
jgi:hypothetical protein